MLLVYRFAGLGDNKIIKHHIPLITAFDFDLD